MTPEAALDAWQQARPVELGYAAVPAEDSQMDQLMLVYQFSNDGTRAYGVDAKTGEVLRYGSDQQPAIAYSDVTAADTEILALAQLGIGFTADRFEKTKGVTQADMVLFLLSANGEYYSAEEMDDAYDRAYYLGILERGQRQEDKRSPAPSSSRPYWIWRATAEWLGSTVSFCAASRMPARSRRTTTITPPLPREWAWCRATGPGSCRPMTRRPGSKWPSCSTTL